MIDWETYWNTVGNMQSAAQICLAAALFYCFVGPYLQEKKHSGLIGIVYAAVMLILKFMPCEINGQIAYGTGSAAVFCTMRLLDKRNVRQKLFLSVTFFHMDIMVKNLIRIPWGFLYEALVMDPKKQEQHYLLFGLFVGMELLYLLFYSGALAWSVRLMNRAYAYKNEDLTPKELALMLAPSFLILTGYNGMQFFTNVYSHDYKKNLWDVYQEYDWILFLYGAAAMAAMLTIVILYQNIKSSRRKEKEELMLARQVEDMEKHIRKVEKLYAQIRGIKHDMGNHVMTLENLCGENEAARQYAARLRKEYQEAAREVRSGNPITDIILREKQKEAEEKGISFQSAFHYPDGGQTDVFDVSVILNNGIDNALEAAAECQTPFVSVSSFYRKNVYMIEIRNSSSRRREPDLESGLLPTSKPGEGHGFGLPNIKRAAGKYHGDIDIRQEDGEFILYVMLLTG